MVVTLPPDLARLDPDTRDAAIALAVEIVTAPERIHGLTPQQSRVVHVLRAAGGRWVTYDALAEAIAPDPSNPPHRLTISSVLCRLRGRPMREHIEIAPRGRGNKGMARWIGGRA